MMKLNTFIEGTDQNLMFQIGTSKINDGLRSQSVTIKAVSLRGAGTINNMNRR